MWKSRRATAPSSGALVATFVLIAASVASAQGTGVICGTVTDVAGGLMPGVTVTLKGPTAEKTAKVVSTDGDYAFAGLIPGTYSLTFDLEGFKRAVTTNLAISAGSEFRRDMRMELGMPAESVEFLSASVAYDRPKPVVGSTFIKDIVTTVSTARPAPPRPCKIEKF